MNASETDRMWTLRTACFSLIAIILVTAAVETLAAVAMMILLGRDGYQTFRHSLGETALFYTLGGAVALAVCVYFAKARTWQEFTSAFALRPTTPRFLIVAGLLGVWIAFILRASRPGGAASIRFETAFNITSASLLVYSGFEETVMRGFFYAAFRHTTPLVVSVLFLVAIDAVLFHCSKCSNPRALLDIGIVNVIACLFRECRKSLWPSITLNLAYSIPFAIFRWPT